MRVPWLVLGLILGLLLFMGCIDIDVKISLNDDGSGQARMTLTVPPGLGTDEAITSKIRQDLGASHWQVADPEHGADGLVFHATKSFSNLGELKEDLGLSGTVSTMKTGLLKKRTELHAAVEGKDLRSFVVTITMPGSIVETNGEKVGSDSVRWVLTNRGGTALLATSTGWLIPFAGILLIVVLVGALLLAMGRLARKHALSPAPMRSEPQGFCAGCGAPLAEGAAYCRQCGEKTE
jgi:hypothetical protein